MVITGLFHVAIKTNNLDATVRFYTEVLGLRQVERPNFGYPGAWLACPTPTGEAIVHIYAGGPALGQEGRAPTGTGAIDHISISAVGFHQFRQKFAEFGLQWREFLVPGTSLWQLFVYDPSGVQLELTFNGAAEAGSPPDMSPGRAYVAGDSFFHAEDYNQVDHQVDAYRLVDCNFHDELEALATLRQSCKMVYRAVDGEVVEVEDQIVDIYAAHKADFLKLKDGTEIRLDRIITVNGKPIEFTCA